MATYPIKMLKDEKGQPFVPYTSVKGIVDYTPGTGGTADLTNYYNKEEIDNKLGSMFLICGQEEFAAMTEEDIKRYYLVVVETEKTT